MIVLNVSEAGLKDTKLLDGLKGSLTALGIDAMQVSAKVEDEVASIESEAERREFLKELGIGEPAVSVLTRLCIKTLNLISFFTVGQDEVRQWTVRRGSSAPEAAGAIHSDLEKGFIRAEVMKYSEWESSGGEESLKSSGKLYLKGKDYIVEDGDMLNIRFNV
jgi:ribosome-binding ATPase YchF (GTP1/OBG family)